MAIAIDDEDSQRLLRLFNTPEGKQYMKDELGMSAEEIEKMSWLGISGIANVLCCIKMAKYYELTENDVVATVLTDSAVMYGSRIEELNQQHGAYNAHEAALDHACLLYTSMPWTRPQAAGCAGSRGSDCQDGHRGAEVIAV